MLFKRFENFKKKSFALSLIVFPFMLLIGFLMHPNILQMNMLKTSQQLVERFHHNPIFHIGHLIVMFSVPVIIVAMMGTMKRLNGKGKLYGFWGGIIGIFGAFILSVDKGALCLVLSAFDTLPEDQFVNLIPYLQVLVNKAGWLFLLWLLPLLPLGAIIQAIGLMKEQVIHKYQGILIIIGLLLLNNPEIELISTVGGLLMCIGYIPWGLKELR